MQCYPRSGDGGVAGILMGKAQLGSYSGGEWKGFSIGSVEDHLFHLILHHLHNSSNTRSQMALQRPNSTGPALRTDGARWWLQAPIRAAWAEEPCHAGSFGGRQRGDRMTGLPAFQSSLLQERREGQRCCTGEVLQSPHRGVSGHRSAFPAC